MLFKDNGRRAVMARSMYHWRAKLGKAMSSRKISIPVGRSLLFYVGKRKTPEEKEARAAEILKVIESGVSEEEILHVFGLEPVDRLD